MFVEVFPESLTTRVGYSLKHKVEGSLGSTNRPHAVMNTARSVRASPTSGNGTQRDANVFKCYAPQSTLNDLKTTTPTKNKVAEGHTHIVINDLTVTLGGVVVPEHLHGSNDVDSGGVGGDENDTLLVVLVFVVRVALAQHKVDCATRIASTADPPAR
jgi:hypothetical protein